MDRRKKKTRQAVYDAFTHLLETKTYSNITVQEIIEEADIGRSTFYAHFETKDELLKALCTEIFDHVFSDDLTREKTHDFSTGSRGLKEEITHMLYHLRDNSRYIKRILSCESGEMFMRYFKDYLTGVFDGELGQEKDHIPRDYLLNHLVCDFAETIRWWMGNEAYTPEEVSSFFLETAPFMQMGPK